MGTEKGRKREGGKGREGSEEGERGRNQAVKRQSPPVFCGSFFTLGFFVVGVPELCFWRYHLYTVQVPGIHGGVFPYLGVIFT